MTLVVALFIICLVVFGATLPIGVGISTPNKIGRDKRKGMSRKGYVNAARRSRNRKFTK